MIVVLSPAKTLDYSFSESENNFSVPQFLDRSKTIVDVVKTLNKKELSKLMNVSDKISELNHERFKKWSKAKIPNQQSKQAGLVFKGDVYLGLEFNKLSKSDIKFAQKHLRILSGLYGMLRPLDLIEPYRLEMGTKISIKSFNNLHHFWREEITNSLNKELRNHKALVNLASVEYFTAVNHKDLNTNVVSPVFKDYKNGKYKVISFFAKKARGLMARYIIQNKIKSPEEILEFNLSGYKFCKKESTPATPVYLRKES